MALGSSNQLIDLEHRIEYDPTYFVPERIDRSKQVDRQITHAHTLLARKHPLVAVQHNKNTP